MRWKAAIPGQGHSSPIVVGDKVLVTTAYLTGRGESLKRAAGMATLVATGLLALLAVTRAGAAGPASCALGPRRPLATRQLLAIALLCLPLGALLLASAFSLSRYEQGELDVERRMELWLLSSLIASLCLVLGALGGRWVRLAAGGLALALAALVVLARPEPQYFDLATPGRYAETIWMAASAPAALGLALLAAHAAGIWRHRAFLPNWLAIAFLCLGAGGFAQRNYLLTRKEFIRAIVCLNKDTGAVLWAAEGLRGPQPVLNRRNSPATPTPVSDGERVMAWFGSAGAMCTDLDGKVLWTNRDLPFECVHGAGPSPMLAEGLLIIAATQAEAPYIAALDPKTGQRVWTTGIPSWPGIEGQHRSPTIVSSANGKEVLLWGWQGAEKESLLRGYDARSGKLLWQRPLNAWNQAVASIISDGDDTLFLANSEEVHALSLAKLGRGGNATLWTTPMKGHGPHVSSPALVGGMLFVVSNKGRASCLEAATGRLLWQEQVGRRGCMASLVAAGGNVYFWDVTGRATVAACGPKFRKVAESDLDEPIWASPAPVGGRLYIRTAGHLWCIEEKQ